MIPDGLAQFLNDERVCVLSVLSTDNRSVHSAPIVYWCDTATLRFYAATSVESEKLAWWRAGKLSTAASISIGNIKGLPYLMQLQGKLEVVESTEVDRVAFEAFIRVCDDRDNPELQKNALMVFTPTKAKYSDWHTNTVHRIDI